VLILTATGLVLAGFTIIGRQTGTFTVHWRPVGEWCDLHMGKSILVVVGSVLGPDTVSYVAGERYSLGFVEVDVLRFPRPLK
jgi:hypothetical protein